MGQKTPDLNVDQAKHLRLLSTYPEGVVIIHSPREEALAESLALKGLVKREVRLHYLLTPAGREAALNTVEDEHELAFIEKARGSTIDAIDWTIPGPYILRGRYITPVLVQVTRVDARGAHYELDGRENLEPDLSRFAKY